MGTQAGLVMEMMIASILFCFAVALALLATALCFLQRQCRLLVLRGGARNKKAASLPVRVWLSATTLKNGERFSATTMRPYARSSSFFSHSQRLVTAPRCCPVHYGQFARHAPPHAASATFILSKYRARL